MATARRFQHLYAIGFFFVAIALGSGSAVASEDLVDASAITIAIDPGEDGIETRVAELLSTRIQRRSSVSVTIAQQGSVGGDLTIALGRRGAGSGWFKGLVERHGLELPGVARVAPESYAVKRVQHEGQPLLIAEGADARGVLYAAGEVLRQLTYGATSISVSPVNMQAAPAYRYRGSSANQGGTMRQITGARGWTAEEWQDYMLDYALSGANTAYASGAQFEFVKQFDLMTVGGCRPNQFRGDIPEGWEAGGLEAWEGTQWVCPSLPDARAALMAQWDEEFAQTQDHDVLRLYAGDPGGCRCPRCEPWGKTFIELCEEVAAIWLKYHPDSTVQIANQDLSNEGDQAIFRYLNETPRMWLEGIAYGPGSNALSTYFRDELRDDLFEYPGSGPVNRYLAETLNNIPKYQTITHYSDITHWISAQYMVENPDPHVRSIYGRRTFHTRPRAFYGIFQDIMPFSQGDIIYSEGYHDEFHQYMWNRLLWNPNRSLEDVMDEYCTYHFGAAAAPHMREAMLQLEANIEAPLAGNPGVDRYYLLVKEAGWKMPPHVMARDYRWRLHMQKAALDKYFQLKLRRERAREAELEALAVLDADSAVARAQALLDTPIETPEMAALREEAARLGEESDTRMGLRNVGYFSMDRSLTSLGWTVKQFEKAAAASGEARQAILDHVAHYEDPGPGGYYDDAGNRDRQPHLVRGNLYDASAWLDPDNRPSQNTIAYHLEDPQGVAFRYDGLDPQAAYRVRVTLVQPRRPQMGDAVPESTRLQNILADGTYIAQDVEAPEYTAKQFEFDIPKEATADGVLELTFERGTGALGVVVSEVWLVKR